MMTACREFTVVHYVVRDLENSVNYLAHRKWGVVPMSWLPSWQSVTLIKRQVCYLMSVADHGQNAPGFSMTWARFIQPFSYHCNDANKV